MKTLKIRIWKRHLIYCYRRHFINSDLRSCSVIDKCKRHLETNFERGLLDALKNIGSTNLEDVLHCCLKKFSSGANLRYFGKVSLINLVKQTLDIFKKWVKSNCETS